MFQDSLYDSVYQCLLSEILQSVCAGEDCRLAELQLCSQSFNICPYQLARGTWAPRAARFPWEAQLKAHSCSPAWTAQPHQHHWQTDPSPTQSATHCPRGKPQNTKCTHAVQKMLFSKAQPRNQLMKQKQHHQRETSAWIPHLHQITCSSLLLLPQQHTPALLILWITSNCSDSLRYLQDNHMQYYW